MSHITSALPRALAMAVIGGFSVTAATEPNDDPMTSFGRSHPQCQQWTNWREVCSRTGQGNPVSCQRDVRLPVAPSAPFCVAGSWPRMPWYVADTPAEQKSRLRFCELTDIEEFGAKKITICRSYSEHRPFNGTRVDTVFDNKCEVVRMVSQDADVCRTDGKPGAPSCRQASAAFRATQPLYCAKWKPGSKCGDSISSGMIAGPSNGIIVAPNRTLSGTPVWGSVCSPSHEGAER